MRDWTVHGGKLSEARRVYGDAAGPWLDLSTGINPHPWPGVNDIVVDWRGLPDDHALRELEDAAAAHFGVDPRFVCSLPGTEIGLRMLDRPALLRPVRHIVPGYRTHGEAIWGSKPIAFANIGPSKGTVLLANPNNPDGRVHDPDELLKIAGPSQWLIVDESFADAHRDISVASHVADDKALLVLRSFGKFFGLAGLRLGFAIGPVGTILDIRRRLGSWPVSTAALLIGTAAYRDTGWIDGMRARLAADAAALDAVLRRHGFDPIGDCPLFRLIETDDAMALFDRLARRAILTRPFDYDARWLRIGLPGSEESLARLDRALADG